MNEFSAPPIPPPGGDVCPACHAPLSGQPKICPHCGTILRQVSTATSCWATLASVVLVFAALAFGGAGACFLLFSGSDYGMGSKSQTYGIIAGCFAAFAACIWAVWALNRRKK